VCAYWVALFASSLLIGVHLYAVQSLGGRSPESKYTNQPRPPIISAFEGAPAVFLSPRQVAAAGDCLCVLLPTIGERTSEKNYILFSLLKGRNQGRVALRTNAAACCFNLS
jgi:hypothetical protein